MTMPRRRPVTPGCVRLYRYLPPWDGQNEQEEPGWRWFTSKKAACDAGRRDLLDFQTADPAHRSEVLQVHEVHVLRARRAADLVDVLNGKGVRFSDLEVTLR